MISEYIELLKNKRIAFIGVGVSNMPIIRAFVKAGIEVSVRDAKDTSKGDYGEELKSLGVKVISGEDYLKGIDEDILFLSPAVRDDKKELLEAKAKGAVLTSEMQEFFGLCPCKILAVTGSDGKTTTTTLIAKLLEAAGKKVHLGGNIGKNLFAELDSITPDDFAVVELSSFQLMKLDVAPDVAVVTNLTPNHLDWHTGMDEYTEAKKNIFNKQSKDNLLVLGADNAVTAKMKAEAEGKVLLFGRSDGSDIKITDEGLWFKGNLILRDEDILLVGAHNRLNYAAAFAAVSSFISPEALVEVAKSFGGVEHRIERVRSFDGVTYYNSSIDSSPTRTAAALESFKDKVIVICGGYDKKIPLEPLGDLFRRKAKAVVLMGDTADKIEAVLNATSFSAPVLKASSMKEAVVLARSLASNGDTVILSPAAASFDMFKNFAQRGEVFKQCVAELC